MIATKTALCVLDSRCSKSQGCILHGKHIALCAPVSGPS